MEGVEVLVKKLIDEAKIPEKQTEGAAGFDLHSSEEVNLCMGERRIIHTGVAICIPEGYFGKISSRSGLAFKRDLYAFDGTIDSDFRGEIMVLLENKSKSDYLVKKGERIAQIILIKHHESVKMHDVKDGILPISKRSKKGFGSSGMF